MDDIVTNSTEIPQKACYNQDLKNHRKEQNENIVSPSELSKVHRRLLITALCLNTFLVALDFV